MSSTGSPGQSVEALGRSAAALYRNSLPLPLSLKAYKSIILATTVLFLVLASQVKSRNMKMKVSFVACSPNH